MAIDKNKIIEAATKFVQKGQYDKAIKEYQKLLEVDPKDARIQQKLGELYQKKGDNTLAADCFLKVAESYAADGFFLKAVAVYKQVLKLNPNLVDVNLKLAELHQQLGLMSDAMAQFQLVANHYEKSGNIRASLDTLRKMVDLDPENVASRIKLAELYARENMNPEAIAEFGRAAEYLKRNNRVDDYIKVAERLVFLDPNNLDLTRELANIYLTKQDTKRALAKLQICFKADPKDVETLTMLAQAFKDLGQIAKTVSVYKELAKIYDEQDRVDEERETWRKIQDLAPEDPDVRSRFAAQAPAAQPAAPVAQPVAQATAQPSRPAQQAASPAAKPAADQIPRLLTETDVYVKYGLHEKAIEHLKKVFAIDPDSVDAHEKAADLFAASGNVQAALDSLTRVVRTCIARNELDRARTALQKLCEKEPTHPEIPGFLNAVGGLAPVEEVAEIEEDAILVEAADEAVEVAPEPEHPVDLAAVSIANSDDAALDAAAESLASEEPQVDGPELLAESPSDEELIAGPGDDELALASAESFPGAGGPGAARRPGLRGGFRRRSLARGWARRLVPGPGPGGARPGPGCGGAARRRGSRDRAQQRRVRRPTRGAVRRAGPGRPARAAGGAGGAGRRARGPQRPPRRRRRDRAAPDDAWPADDARGRAPGPRGRGRAERGDPGRRPADAVDAVGRTAGHPQELRRRRPAARAVLPGRPAAGRRLR
ncbi:MAG: tetratricopeptide repeat protein [Myxococcales bacterium]